MHRCSRRIAEAESGSLTILVGGPTRRVKRARPLLEAFGSPIHVGTLGTWRGGEARGQCSPVRHAVLCHRGIIPQLSGAMAEIERRGLAGEIQSFDGCYSPRMQFPEPTSISRHAFGIAVDLNASTNRFGDPPMQDPALVEVMERWGFGWGGRWTIPDGMHFEFLFFPD